MRGKEKKDKSQIEFQKVIEKYKKTSYQLFGKKFEQKKRPNLEEKLVKADMNYTPALFYSLITLNTIIVTITSLITYFIIFNIILNYENWILYTTALTLLNIITTIEILPILLKMRISNKKMRTEQDLPFALSELSVLASTGLTPIKIVRHMAKNSGSDIIKKEFQKLVHKIDIEGKDIVTAVGETAKETPSNTFRETLWDLANMIHQGGDLDTYLREKADQTMQLRRDIQEEFIETLGTYSEIYISLVLIGVIFIGIAAFLLDALGESMMGIDSETLLILLAYGLIPLAVIVVNVIISSAYSKNG